MSIGACVFVCAGITVYDNPPDGEGELKNVGNVDPNAT